MLENSILPAILQNYLVLIPADNSISGKLLSKTTAFSEQAPMSLRLFHHHREVLSAATNRQYSASVHGKRRMQEKTQKCILSHHDNP
jgi:hypothetical protein